MGIYVAGLLFLAVFVIADENIIETKKDKRQYNQGALFYPHGDWIRNFDNRPPGLDEESLATPTNPEGHSQADDPRFHDDHSRFSAIEPLFAGSSPPRGYAGSFKGEYEVPEYFKNLKHHLTEGPDLPLPEYGPPPEYQSTGLIPNQEEEYGERIVPDPNSAPPRPENVQYSRPYEDPPKLLQPLEDPSSQEPLPVKVQEQPQESPAESYVGKDTLGYPKRPEHSTKSEYPARPEYPTQPGHPARPEYPTKLEYPTTTEKYQHVFQPQEEPSLPLSTEEQDGTYQKPIPSIQPDSQYSVNVEIVPFAPQYHETSHPSEPAPTDPVQMLPQYQKSIDHPPHKSGPSSDVPSVEKQTNTEKPRFYSPKPYEALVSHSAQPKQKSSLVPDAGIEIPEHGVKSFQTDSGIPKSKQSKLLENRKPGYKRISTTTKEAAIYPATEASPYESLRFESKKQKEHKADPHKSLSQDGHHTEDEVKEIPLPTKHKQPYYGEPVAYAPGPFRPDLIPEDRPYDEPRYQQQEEQFSYKEYQPEPFNRLPFGVDFQRPTEIPETDFFAPDDRFKSPTPLGYKPFNPFSDQEVITTEQNFLRDNSHQLGYWEQPKVFLDNSVNFWDQREPTETPYKEQNVSVQLPKYTPRPYETSVTVPPSTAAYYLTAKPHVPAYVPKKTIYEARPETSGYSLSSISIPEYKNPEPTTLPPYSPPETIVPYAQPLANYATDVSSDPRYPSDVKPEMSASPKLLYSPEYKRPESTSELPHSQIETDAPRQNPYPSYAQEEQDERYASPVEKTSNNKQNSSVDHKRTYSKTEYRKPEATTVSYYSPAETSGSYNLPPSSIYVPQYTKPEVTTYASYVPPVTEAPYYPTRPVHKEQVQAVQQYGASEKDLPHSTPDTHPVYKEAQAPQKYGAPDKDLTYDTPDKYPYPTIDYQTPTRGVPTALPNPYPETRPPKTVVDYRPDSSTAVPISYSQVTQSIPISYQTPHALYAPIRPSYPSVTETTPAPYKTLEPSFVPVSPYYNSVSQLNPLPYETLVPYSASPAKIYFQTTPKPILQKPVPIIQSAPFVLPAIHKSPSKISVVPKFPVQDKTITNSIHPNHQVPHTVYNPAPQHAAYAPAPAHHQIVAPQPIYLPAAAPQPSYQAPAAPQPVFVTNAAAVQPVYQPHVVSTSGYAVPNAVKPVNVPVQVPAYAPSPQFPTSGQGAALVSAPLISSVGPNAGNSVGNQPAASESQWTVGTIPYVLEKMGLNSLVDLVILAELDSVLEKEGPFTVFVPTDKAFEFLTAKFGGQETALAQFEKDPEGLKSLLKSHMVPNLIPSIALSDNFLLQSVLGSPLRFRVTEAEDNDWKPIKVVTANGARILKTDIKATNGIIHIIDRVMFPIPQADIYSTLKGDPQRRFTVLTTAIERSGLAPTLADPRGGPFTIFAPTDKAFKQINKLELNKLLTNPPALAQLLQKHVVRDAIFTAGLLSYQVPLSIAGTPLNVFHMKGSTKVNGANVIEPDIPTVNGVIHIIDSVLGL